MCRSEITPTDIRIAKNDLDIHFRKVLDKKGYGSFASIYEMLGVLRIELKELEDGIHARDWENIKHELLDVISTALFGYACINSEKMDIY